MSLQLAQQVLPEARTTITGLPALLIILAIIAFFIGIGVLIGKAISRRRG